MKRFLTRRVGLVTLSALALVAVVIGGVFAFLGKTPPARANQFNQALTREHNDTGNEATGSGEPSQEQYDNRAYPATDIGYDQTVAASNAWQALSTHSGVPHSGYWQLVGPSNPSVPGAVTYTGNAANVSGRTTAIAVSSTCGSGVCRVWIGTAGGGVWETNNGLAQNPEWHSASDGLPTNAIGSLIIDPTDPTGRTLYVGTGEANGSSDSEAGMGLFKSTDGGDHWTAVAGSAAVAANRAIGSIAVDPQDPQHIFIGTAVARHGVSSVNGGRYTPPAAPKIGLYESTDGGATFTLAYSKTSDSVNPSSPTGGDFFRGGVSKIVFDPTTAGQVYFSMFDYGLFRGHTGAYQQVYFSPFTGNPGLTTVARTEFALAPLDGGKLRIYLGDAGTGVADFYRTDDAAALNGTDNSGWTKLSSSNKADPGYGSYNFCEGQCSYDMAIEAIPGHPDTVYIAGSMNYNEIFTAHQPSNGRAVQRSTDAGVHFTDMTNDVSNNGMHPDQHAIAFAPGTEIGFFASDGGMVRTSGAFADASSSCDSRGLSGQNLANCHAWLSAIPTRTYFLNNGLSTLEFQSVTVNPQNPVNDVIGGTQDNGTWAWNGPADKWFESVGGDGGQSAISYGNPNIRMHTYYGPQIDVNFNGTNPTGWDWTSDVLFASGEASSFYVPLIADPKAPGTDFVGLQHVFRTTDNGGQQAYLDQHCNELTGDFTVSCGDWQPLGQNLTGSTFGSDKGGSYVVAIARANDASTLWSATRRGRLFISTNGNAADPSTVSFTRIDDASTPTRFISGINVDPSNPYHAYVSFSGYDAYASAAGTATGHVFSVVYDPATGKATWTNISNDLGDVPVTGIAFDGNSGALFASSDFGVAKLDAGSSSWTPAAPGLPTVAVYGLTIDTNSHLLYAATHGRGIWRVDLSK